MSLDSISSADSDHSKTIYRIGRLLFLTTLYSNQLPDYTKAQLIIDVLHKNLGSQEGHNIKVLLAEIEDSMHYEQTWN